MSNYINTSLGPIEPRTGSGNGSAVLIDNPVFDGRELGTVSCGDTYTAELVRYMGGNEVHIRKNGVLIASTLIALSNPQYAGFIADLITSTTVKVYAVCTNNYDIISTAFPLIVGYAPGMYYQAVVIGEFNIEDVSMKWDEGPSATPGDFGNNEPAGGENADTDPYWLTEDMLETDIPDGSDLEIDTSTFLTNYVLSNTELAALGTKLFATTFWQSLANKFSGLSDPMKFIVRCNVMPFVAYDDSKTMHLGGEDVGLDHSVACLKTRFLQFSFGSITLKETWGTDKDYSATSIDIFLPYSGVHSIDVDAVMQTTLTLKCNVDAWTGDMVYILHSSNADMNSKYFKQENVLYRWSGNCATSLPIGTVDPSGPIIRGFSSLAGMAAGFAIGGPMGAALGGAAANGIGTSAGGAAAYNKHVTGIEGYTSGTSGIQLAGAGLAGASAASAVLNMDFTPLGGAGNGVSGASGMMDYQFPYLIIKRGVPAYPNNWRAQIGAPRYQTFTLSDLSGFTLFADIKLQNMGVAVQEEIAELERLLTTEGVIL